MSSRVVVVIRSSKAQRCYTDERSVPEILGKIAEWLAVAESVARKSGTCVAFSVEVHQAGSSCDHERPGHGYAG